MSKSKSKSKIQDDRDGSVVGYSIIITLPKVQSKTDSSTVCRAVVSAGSSCALYPPWLTLTHTSNYFSFIYVISPPSPNKQQSLADFNTHFQLFFFHFCNFSTYLPMEEEQCLTDLVRCMSQAVWREHWSQRGNRHPLKPTFSFFLPSTCSGPFSHLIRFIACPTTRRWKGKQSTGKWEHPLVHAPRSNFLSLSGVYLTQIWIFSTF